MAFQATTAYVRSLKKWVITRSGFITEVIIWNTPVLLKWETGNVAWQKPFDRLRAGVAKGVL